MFVGRAADVTDATAADEGGVESAEVDKTINSILSSPMNIPTVAAKNEWGLMKLLELERIISGLFDKM